MSFNNFNKLNKIQQQQIQLFGVYPGNPVRKLLFFGDSFVQGNGLSGLDHTADSGTYSKETFPTLTANLLNTT